MWHCLSIGLQGCLQTFVFISIDMPMNQPTCIQSIILLLRYSCIRWETYKARTESVLSSFALFFRTL